MEGYQGAQLLPDFFLEKSNIDPVMETLLPLQKVMYKDLQIEANKQPQRKAFHSTKPGFTSPPPHTKNAQKMEQVRQFRTGLPTYKRRDEIVSCVKENDVTIICGDTGCGKTTQIPQLLYDSGIFPRNDSIICTQPRRISALSVANRVAAERDEACGDSCGYVIRFENMTSPQTRIIYATTGILLRRLHTEPDLCGVSCVVVDEVHERDVETDFCLLLLRDRLREQREDPSRFATKLKVVVMSATIQIETLERYFDGCNGGSPVPIVRIPGTLFPVEEYFLEDVLTWLEKSTDSASDTSESASLYNELKSSVFSNVERDAEYMIPFEVVVDLIVHIHQEYSRNHSESILVFLPGWAAISRVMKMLQNSSVSRQLSILPLHSSLTTREQQRVFDAPPRGYRKIVLATSIAETSITIDDIVYVIDGGLVKGTSYDPLGNMSSLKASLISKANGTQRRGRAGRCRAGVCVHLLSREVYDALPDFLQPDIVRSPLEEVCLQIKAIRPDERCQHVLSRAMDAPPTTSVKFAVDFLTEMGALTEKEEQLTNLGRALAQLPVHPLLGKMLFAAACLGVLEPVSTIAAGLSVKSVFVRPQVFERDAAQESIQRLDNGDLSDHLCVLKVYEGWVRSGRSVSYAQSHFADSSTLRSLERTKRQLTRYVLQSPLLRRVNNPEQMSSCHRNNTGLIRLVVLWSLYPRLATTEYRANRPGIQMPNIYCWDNKVCLMGGGSCLFKRKRGISSTVLLLSTLSECRWSPSLIFTREQQCLLLTWRCVCAS
ncbi:ATP-dependent RNA helicase DHX36 [Angomonas deanei]|uniref:RNA helicase n=1 Tax=Angomonas deanei TaxID=59799 RepID=A0A7G2CQU0_9TRYP|nr:ATP-dependent RNA helicase DHX36 [Angomonas deanei]CAD2220552.1 DEAD/DEAH box helicase/Helicase conserved C-terminal domain/Helicase associated domain (HA2), putative [Angomonas deanei]|eukprot:EPY29956.1 ATP-dependent RNA helicase DHX36 [Angomonas deanei]